MMADNDEQTGPEDSDDEMEQNGSEEE